MSPVGHSLVGLAFAAIALPASRDLKWKIGLPVVFVALASLPDWPIPNWGHDRYDISHSIYVNVTLIGLALLLWRSIPKFRFSLSTGIALLGAGAWFSHLILDSFYNHGRGLMVCWPFSDGRLNLSMPWFNTMKLSQGIFSQHNLSVYGIEFVAYSPVLLIAIAVGTFIRRRNRVV